MGKVLEARKRIGGLSTTSKMPSKSWGISATLCTVGAKLRNVVGATCRDCYALKGAYLWGATKRAHARRLEAWKKNPNWIEDFTISLGKMEYFRWFDSGDLQSLSMLEAIAHVARNTPNTKHWLPTREYKVVRNFLRKNGSFPNNLTVRVSAPMVNGSPSAEFANTSTTHSTETPSHGVECPAYTPSHGGKCGDCRNCWNAEVTTVSYRLH